jgi:nitroreductase
MKSEGETVMSFHELARSRFSVRDYREDPVEEDKIRFVLEAARIAPSAANRQPWRFVVVRDQKLRAQVNSTYGKKWIEKAPVVIVACGDHDLSWKRNDGKDHLDIDIAIAVDHMTLAAADKGLGTCWICAFDAAACHHILDLPDRMEAVALLPLGYPAEKGDANRHVKARKKLEEIVSWR